MDTPADDHVDLRVERLAHEPFDDVDAGMLADLARAVSAEDPMPPGLVERAIFAVALEEMAVELATIQRETALGQHGLAGVRSVEDHALTMTFTASALTLTIAVVETDRQIHRMDGWVTSDHLVTVRLRLGDEERRQVEVVDGRFVFEDVPSGMVQVIVESQDDDAATVVTPVFEL